jgi:tetratricopeptide (TPR) repeat protein
MPRARSFLGAFLFVAAALPAGQVRAQSAPQVDTPPTLVMPRWGERRQFASPVPSPFMLQPVPIPVPGMSRGYPYYEGYSYFGQPWYLFQTQKYKYPVPQYAEPRLGLQYLYPYGYQFGIQIPPETDEPVYPPYLAPDHRVALRPSLGEGIALMKKGQYVDAGRRFARALRDEGTPPEVYLLLAEAFLGAGKLDDAELVLRQAVDSAHDLDFLDHADLVSNFPSRDALKEKLGQLGAGSNRLLSGTFLTLAGERDKGLEILKAAAKDKDDAARRVYLHFLGAAFGAEESKPPEGKAQPSKEKKSTY